MRILVLNWRDLKHPRAGGSEVYSQHLARFWATQGHDVTFFCAASPGLAAREEVDGYQVVRRGNRFMVYREARAFYRESGVGRYDAVLDVINARPFLTPRWRGDSALVALVHHVEGEVWHYEVPLPAALLGRYILEPRWLRAYRDCRVLTVSESSRKELIELGLRNVTVVHEGVDQPIARPLPPKAAVPTWLFVGRLTPNKRPDHAILAHRRLRELLPEANLWVVGDGPMEAELRKLAGPGVEFFGRVDAGVKQDLMASAHAVIGTGVREGWGLTISEAARLGTRAIAYDVVGLRDSVPPAGGVLVEPSPGALAAAAARLLPQWMAEGRADLGDAGVLDWDQVAEEVLEHIQAEVEVNAQVRV